MMPYYAILALIVCIFGLLLWLTRNIKHEGGVEVQTAILQEALNAKSKEAEKLAAPARSESSIVIELRAKAAKHLPDANIH